MEIKIDCSQLNRDWIEYLPDGLVMVRAANTTTIAYTVWCDCATLDDMGSKDTDRTLETTKTSLELIERIVELNGAGLTELTEATDLAENTVYNHLSTLSEYGYAVNERNQYYLGTKY